MGTYPTGCSRGKPEKQFWHHSPLLFLELFFLVEDLALEDFAALLVKGLLKMCMKDEFKVARFRI
jgi:hypothetical protein